MERSRKKVAYAWGPNVGRCSLPTLVIRSGRSKAAFVELEFVYIGFACYSFSWGPVKCFSERHVYAFTYEAYYSREDTNSSTVEFTMERIEVKVEIIGHSRAALIVTTVQLAKLVKTNGSNSKT